MSFYSGNPALCLRVVGELIKRQVKKLEWSKFVQQSPRHRQCCLCYGFSFKPLASYISHNATGWHVMSLSCVLGNGLCLSNTTPPVCYSFCYKCVDSKLRKSSWHHCDIISEMQQSSTHNKEMFWISDVPIQVRDLSHCYLAAKIFYNYKRSAYSVWPYSEYRKHFSFYLDYSKTKCLMAGYLPE